MSVFSERPLAGEPLLNSTQSSNQSWAQNWAQSSIRLFFAVDPGGEARGALLPVLDALKTSASSVGPGVRWVRPENIHVTLKFLGETSAERAQELIPWVERGLGDVSAAECAFSKIAMFRSGRSESVVYADVDDAGPLSELAGKIDAILEPLGYQRERRHFRAHATLARVRSPQAARVFKLQLPHICLNVPFEVDCVTLFRSDPGREGPVYTPVGRVLLSAKWPL